MRPRRPRWRSGSSRPATAASSRLLDCEDELLALADAVEIAHFLEASSAVVDGPYDLSLVEGSITTPHDAERIRRCGAPPAAGHDRRLRDRRRHPGAAQLRRRRRLRVGRLRRRPDYIATLATSTPIAAHVDVDFELHGCPIDKQPAARGASRAFLNGRRPAIARAQRLHRVQAARHRLRDGRPRHAVPRARSRTPAAAPSAPRTTAAATAASGPMETPNTAALSDAAARQLGHERRRPRPRLPHVQRRRRAVPRRERSAMSAEPRTRTIRTDSSPASRARARCTCASRDGEVERRRAEHLRAAAVLRGAPARPRLHRGARHHRADLRHLPGRLPDERGAGDRGRLRRRRSPSRSATLRRLLYCGEWIESHALHVYMLHAPDFLGYDERDRDGRATTARSSSAACSSRRPATR